MGPPWVAPTWERCLTRPCRERGPRSCDRTLLRSARYPHPGVLRQSSSCLAQTVVPPRPAAETCPDQPWQNCIMLKSYLICFRVAIDTSEAPAARSSPRTIATALDYVRSLARDTRANCWELAERAGHGLPYRMQGLLGKSRWRWEDLRDLLPGLAQDVLRRSRRRDRAGAAIDETADLRKGNSTACVAPQHAGVTGKIENCVTWVFSALVTASGRPGPTSTRTCRTAGRRTRDAGRRRDPGGPVVRHQA